MARQGVPGSLIAAVSIALALLLFFTLNGNRQGAEDEPSELIHSEGSTFAPPPPLAVPDEAPIEMTPQPQVAPQPIFFPQSQPVISRPPRPQPGVLISTPAQASSLVQPSYSAPEPLTTETPAAPASTGSNEESALVLDVGGPPAGQITGAATAATDPSDNAPPQSPGADAGVVRPVAIGNPTTVVPVGTFIRAVLETAIDTSRPGLVRAIVSQPTRGFDGRRVLIPRGSRVVGEYQSDVRAGQERVLVTWTRLIRPDGSTVRIDSPAADSAGSFGVPGRYRSYFLERFASGMLQSALSLGTNWAVASRGGPVIIGLPNAVGSAVPSPTFAEAPQPKITVRQGTEVSIFVARDLDFSAVAARP